MTEKHQSRSDRRWFLPITLLACLGGAIYLLMPHTDGPRAPSLNLACRVNLQNIYVALEQYLDDNDLRGLPGALSLSDLVEHGYLEPEEILCPFRVLDWQVKVGLKEAKSYQYAFDAAGKRLGSPKGSAEPLCWDTSGNHDGHWQTINCLFSDSSIREINPADIPILRHQGNDEGVP